MPEEWHPTNEELKINPAPIPNPRKDVKIQVL